MSFNLHIAAITNQKAIPFDLLELADPSRQQIESYLKTGTCYIAKLDANIIGALVLNKINATTIEIKNIAVKTSEQGKGYGKRLLRYATKTSRALGHQTLIIGTGNSSIGQLALYQKEGFEIDHIKTNFFTKHYPEPIFENGIQCKHMVMLKKAL